MIGSYLQGPVNFVLVYARYLSARVFSQERDEARKALESAVAAAPGELANGKRPAGPEEDNGAEVPAKRVRRALKTTCLWFCHRSHKWQSC